MNLNLTTLWSVLALGLIITILRAVDTHQSPSNGSKSNPATLPMTFDRPASSRRFASPQATLPVVRQAERGLSIQTGFPDVPDVSVSCSASDLVLRVKPTFYGLWADAEELRLGDTCRSNGVLRPYGDLLFTYPLTACGALRQSDSHYVAYKFVLHYEPSARRWPKFDVDIECRYPRKYHVSKLVVTPHWKTAVLHKRLKGLSKNFHIELMDDSWIEPASSHVYQLASQINFQVSAFYIPPGAKVYISSCFAAPAHSSGSALKHIVIDNSGCLLDSRKEPGASQFISRTDNTLRFSLKAFQFVAEPEIAMKVQCQLLVTSERPGPAHKSCTYRGNGWEALTGEDSICECCDSQCVTSKQRRAMIKGSATSQLLMVSDQTSEKEKGLSSATSTSSSMSRDGGSATSRHINNLQSLNNQGATDVDLGGKYETGGRDDRYDTRSKLDPDKRGYMGELSLEKNKSTVTRSGLFRDTGSVDSVDKDIKKSEEIEFEGENDDISQPEQVQALNWKEIEQILTQINHLREQRDSEEVEETMENNEKDEKTVKMSNSEVKFRNGTELDGDGLMTWFFW